MAREGSFDESGAARLAASVGERARWVEEGRPPGDAAILEKGLDGAQGASHCSILGTRCSISEYGAQGASLDRLDEGGAPHSGGAIHIDPWEGE
jgi:hypothetical protein